MSYKIDSFNEEIEYIINPAFRAFAEIAIETLPDYFWEVPASSTGKYHPSYATGVGGLYAPHKSGGADCS